MKMTANEFHLVSLGWVADGENGFDVFELSQEAIVKEVLKRHRAERAYLPVKLEHIKDEASTVALMHDQNPDIAIRRAEEEVLAKGLGVSFWLLDSVTYKHWKGTWDKQHSLIEHWLETERKDDYDADLSDIVALEEQFWSLFKDPPLAQISVAEPSIGMCKAQEIAREIWLTCLKKMGELETIV